jgi:tungstate transport system ATP-binding protein
MIPGEMMYCLENLTKKYDDRVVLHVERLKIYAGEVLALVGPSGAGKSTLLRQLNFLERPTTGHLSFNGYSANGTPPPLEARRKVITVFQRPVLLNRSVAANVAYGLNIRGKRGRLIEQSVATVLSQVGLADLARTSACTLSGGEAQRVALARALVVEPEVMLMDEPTANLDPYNVKLIEQIITRVNRDQGVTIVLVTHNIFQAKRLAHRTGFLLEGRLIEITDTATLFERPTDPRTAAFVNGEMVY